MRVPEGVNAAEVVATLRDRFYVEVGGGLGSLAGKVFRVGLMGYNNRLDNVAMLLSTLSVALASQGFVSAKAQSALQAKL